MTAPGLKWKKNPTFKNNPVWEAALGPRADDPDRQLLLYVQHFHDVGWCYGIMGQDVVPPSQIQAKALAGAKAEALVLAEQTLRAALGPLQDALAALKRAT